MVNGYQDEFNGLALNSHWTVQGSAVYTVTGGVLKVTSAAGDPNHLMYAAPGYDGAAQEVLARVRILNFGTGDAARCGIGVGLSTTASPAGGINFFFRDHNSEGQVGRHFAFLDDLRAWGPGVGLGFTNNVWYWLRLRQETNAAAGGGVNDVFAKVWRADGAEPEPANWQLTWDYVPTRAVRSGFAGLSASSSGGLAEWEVDYFLVKAAGLPLITVNPEAFPAVQEAVAITNQPQSVTVMEQRTAVFWVGASGFPPLAYQWLKNGELLPGATNAWLQWERVPLADDGSQFQAVVSNTASNQAHSVTSAPAWLSVQVDETAPALAGARSVGLNRVLVSFSEAVDLSTATNLANYQVYAPDLSPINLAGVLAEASPTNVTLLVDALEEPSVYRLVVSGVRDLAATPNLIAPGSELFFTALLHTPQDLGGASPAGGIAAVPGGYDITGGGGGQRSADDTGQFSWAARTGDFDVRVRVAALSGKNPWARAGLIARETLDEGARFAAALATPGISGAFFSARSTNLGAAAASGCFPVNYPATWLRLRRAANLFAGYASHDGLNWRPLGSVDMPLPETVFLGFLVASHRSGETAAAQFRDFTVVTNAGRAAGLDWEPPGPSSRRTALVISEIMYNATPRPGTINVNPQGLITNSLEFIELFNTRAEPEDLGGFQLDGEVDYTFPPGTVLEGGGFLVVARFPADVQDAYGLSGVLGPYANRLRNSSGTLRLRHRTGAVLLEINYDSRPPWPVAADGSGHSLVLARPTWGENEPLAWKASDLPGGSPGRADPVTEDPLAQVVINEFLARSTAPAKDFIELYNRSDRELDLSGAILSDSPSTNKFIVPGGVTIPPRGFRVFYEDELGFALNAGGETIYWRSGVNGRVLDVVLYESQVTQTSSGRSPDGGDLFSELAAMTPGTNNAAPLTRDIVINEIMYAPPSGDEEDQYVELFNKGANAINVGGWRFVDGIQFEFPPATVIPAQGFLVVAKNRARLLSRHPHLNTGNTVGDFSGQLARRGERVALAALEQAVATNQLWGLRSLTLASANALRRRIPATTTNPSNAAAPYVVVDEVTYASGGRWGRWSHGGGSSLELTDPRSDNRLAPNWADSDETAKSAWTAFSVTGRVDLGNVTPDSLQILLLGAGECLVDDLEVLNHLGQNLVPNSTFDSGAAGWVAEGTESLSGWRAPEGTNSGCYHLVAVDRGDNQVNRVRCALTAAPATNQNAVIRGRVRWLRGHPEILFRLRGNWFEAGVRMAVPATGTPGLANSRLRANAGPAITAVNHQPVLPAADEAVVVTARVHDPDGVAAVWLRYRFEPGGQTGEVAMTDDGAGGDAVPGDGIYAGVIPGQSAGALAAFYIEAVDGAGQPAMARFPDNAPQRECLARFGEAIPAGNLPVYRLWMTAATFSNWSARAKLDNTPHDVTFVVGQRVIYNAEALFAGSPYIAPGFTTPSGNRCGYSVQFPADDLFLGDQDLVLDWPGGHGNESTAIQEQMAYWLADRLNLPFSHRHFIRLFVNGVADLQRGTVFEAVMQPNGDYLKQWSPAQPEGDFFKIDRAFEFNDSGSRVADPMPTLQNFTNSLGKKTERYRWTWLRRAYDSALDYTPVFRLVDAVNAPAPEPYTSDVERLVDAEQWMGVFAFEHIINNFDSWGHDIGKNMYAFKPRGGRWVLYPFDLDWLMLVSPGGPGGYTASTGPLFNSNDPTVARLYAHPPFRRAYWRAVKRAVDGPLLGTAADPVMDAKHRLLVDNQVDRCDGRNLEPPGQVKAWFAERRAFLLAQLSAVAANFAMETNLLETSSNLVVLRGTAPIEVGFISVNGIRWKPEWTSVSNWVLRVPVGSGNQQLTLAGLTPELEPVAQAEAAVTVVYPGPEVEPQGRVVFSEIMHRPTVAGAEFVELHNASATHSFDLSRWRIGGLDYVFPDGARLDPGGYLLLGKDADCYATAYPLAPPLFDVYAGNLKAGGETLRLWRPLPPPAPAGAEELVDAVRYESGPPWPGRAGGLGASLQVLDPSRDNSRVANWTDGRHWRFVSITGSNLNIGSSSNLTFSFGSAGELYLDDICLVTGRVAEAGVNLVRNGGFEEPLSGEWILPTNMTASSRATNISHRGRASLRLLAASGGSSVSTNVSLHQALPIASYQTYTLSFWYLPSDTLTNLNARLTSWIRTVTPSNVHSAGLDMSPGAAPAAALPLPDLPPVWINEVQPQNLGDTLDNQGEIEPWIELFNGGAHAVSLAGWHLSTRSDRLDQWTFPDDAVLPPGQFMVVWADGQPEQTDADHWHANFRLEPGSGAVYLSVPIRGQPGVLDYLVYSNLPPGKTHGSYPDGQLFERQLFHYPTPGASNNPALPPLLVTINEWMSDNTATLADPADGSYEDWFELFNAGSAPADLSGYFLTDNLTNRSRFQIPDGYVIPPGGYLLAWADNSPAQNSSNSLHLHVDFRLNRLGEAIGLFAPDGSLVDAVVFGPQPANVSDGRYPDGGAQVYHLPAPTPGTNNAEPFLGNSRPVVDPVGLRSLFPGQTLSLTISAFDSDWPPQGLTFSLGPGAAPGAQINQAGQFVWTPPPEHPPGTNYFSVIVTDDGTPALSTTVIFPVILGLPPRFAGGGMQAEQGLFSFQVHTLPGQRYAVQYKERLTDPAWLPLGEPRLADSFRLNLQDTLEASPHRFYRVIVVETEP